MIQTNWAAVDLMETQWYYAEGDKPVGPLALADLITVLTRVSGARDVLVWRDGLAGWTRAELVAELTSHVVKPPPVPTPIPRQVETSSVAISRGEKDGQPLRQQQLEGRERQLEGIGGWLVLVAIGQVLGLIRLLVNILTLDNRLLVQFPAVFFSEALLTASLHGITIYVSLLFFSKSARFPFWFVLQFAAALLFFPLDLILVSSALSQYTGQSSGESVSDLISVKDIAQWIALALSASIWIPYIQRSKRVANTFRKNAARPTRNDLLISAIVSSWL